MVPSPRACKSAPVPIAWRTGFPSLRINQLQVDTRQTKAMVPDSHSLPITVFHAFRASGFVDAFCARRPDGQMGGRGLPNLPLFRRAGRLGHFARSAKPGCFNPSRQNPPAFGLSKALWQANWGSRQAWSQALARFPV